MGTFRIQLGEKCDYPGSGIGEGPTPFLQLATGDQRRLDFCRCPRADVVLALETRHSNGDDADLDGVERDLVERRRRFIPSPIGCMHQRAKVGLSKDNDLEDSPVVTRSPAQVDALTPSTVLANKNRSTSQLVRPVAGLGQNPD